MPNKLKKPTKPLVPQKKTTQRVPKLRHSPKPWTISQPSGNDGEAEVIIDAKGRIIAWTANSYNEKNNEEFISPQDKANGTLIANAPILLGALEKIVRLAGPKPTAELAIAKEALAKLKP
jgi:hypothetical protein